MTPVEKSERERDEKFAKFYPVIIIDTLKAPKTTERLRIMRNAWNKAWDLAFEAGQRAGEAGWISVEERLPEYGDDVLTWDGRTRCIAHRVLIGSRWKWDSGDPYTYDGDKSHWQPIPNPPVAGPIGDKGDANADTAHKS